MSRSEFWPVPYHSKLEGPISPGQTLIVKGLVTGDRFDVNLQAGQDKGSNVILHLSIRAKEKAIVLNTFEGGAWGAKEQRLKDPFKAGEPFDLRIRAHDNKFEIFANQKEIGEFEYRLSLTSATHLLIEGTVELHAVSWGGRYYPVPYKINVEGGLKTGKRLFISGHPEKSAKRFSVNLLESNGDIALHFDVRFDEKHVVRNSKKGDTWQAEEREGKFPFQKDIGFDLIISNEQGGFQLYVDGTKFGHFTHRFDPNSVTGLEIAGDLELQGIFVK